jgi:hypothetical protein
MSMPIEENVSIVAATTDHQIIQTRDVMLQRRPGIAVDDYLPAARRMMESDGYRLCGFPRAGCGSRGGGLSVHGNALLRQDHIFANARASTVVIFAFPFELRSNR